jgi:hypothetical protein
MWSWFSQSWQFITGIVVGLLIAVAQIIYQRQPKQLDWELRHDVRLISPQARHLREKLELQYDGTPLVYPRVLVIRVANTGKKAVSAQDFDGGDPVKIGYESNPPFDVQLVAASPGLSAEDVADVKRLYGLNGSKRKGAVEIVPKLLNAGEWFDVQMLSDYDHGDITVTSRFADQRRPMKRLDLNQVRPRWPMFALALPAFVGGLATALLTTLSPAFSLPGNRVFSAVLLTVMLGLSLLAVVSVRNLLHRTSSR